MEVTTTSGSLMATWLIRTHEGASAAIGVLAPKFEATDQDVVPTCARYLELLEALLVACEKSAP